MSWGWQRDRVTLQLNCFGDVTVYIIPENWKTNKCCADLGKSGSPGIIKLIYECINLHAKS